MGSVFGEINQLNRVFPRGTNEGQVEFLQRAANELTGLVGGAVVALTIMEDLYNNGRSRHPEWRNLLKSQEQMSKELNDLGGAAVTIAGVEEIVGQDIDIVVAPEDIETPEPDSAAEVADVVLVPEIDEPVDAFRNVEDDYFDDDDDDDGMLIPFPLTPVKQNASKKRRQSPASISRTKTPRSRAAKTAREERTSAHEDDIPVWRAGLIGTLGPHLSQCGIDPDAITFTHFERAARIWAHSSDMTRAERYAELQIERLSGSGIRVSDLMQSFGLSVTSVKRFPYFVGSRLAKFARKMDKEGVNSIDELLSRIAVKTSDLKEAFVLLNTGDLGWQDDSICPQTDPEAFFPEKGGSTREAKKVCRSCDVRSECLEYAQARDERFGIWGGLSERERRRLKKRAV